MLQIDQETIKQVFFIRCYFIGEKLNSRVETPKTEYSQRLCEEKTKVAGSFFEKDNDNSSGIGNILGKTHKKRNLKTNLRNKSNFKKYKDQKWYNLSCHQRQKILNSLGKALTKIPITILMEGNTLT